MQPPAQQPIPNLPDTSAIPPRVSVLIPAYNESKRLPQSVDLYYQPLVGRYGGEVELVILANGCSDNTYDVACELARTRPQMLAYETKEKIGKGGAVLWGFELARGELVAFVDADGSTAPDSLLALLEAVDDTADVAIGSRWLPESIIVHKQPLKRRILSRVFNLLVRTLLPLPFKDTQCGAKAFKHRVLVGIAPDVEKRGWAFDVELLLRLKQRHLDIRMREVPIEWNDSSGSRLRAHTDGPSMLKDLLWLRFSRPASPAGKADAPVQALAACAPAPKSTAEEKLGNVTRN